MYNISLQQSRQHAFVCRSLHEDVEHEWLSGEERHGTSDILVYEREGGVIGG